MLYREGLGAVLFNDIPQAPLEQYLVQGRHSVKFVKYIDLITTKFIEKLCAKAMQEGQSVISE